MKKFFVAAIATLGMMSATVSFADALNGAAGKKLSVMSTRLNQDQMKMHNVDVTVLNRSDNNILVQNPPYVNDFVESGASDRLYSDGSGAVQVQLVNTYNNTIFFNQYVCNRAVVTVKGRYSSLIVYLDNSQCY
jgi:hypothetical protein